MATRYEQQKQCLVNFKATRIWREMAHKQAQERGMNLSEYIKALIATDSEEDNWRGIADDLYAELKNHDHPIPQSVINAMVRYERFQQARF